MDEILIHGLTFHAKHGCHPQERKTGGLFEVDISLHTSISAAAETDDIQDAVDYVQVMSLIEEIMLKPKNLIESVAKEICQSCLQSFSSVERVELTIKKLGPPVKHDVKHVGVRTSLDRSANI